MSNVAVWKKETRGGASTQLMMITRKKSPSPLSPVALFFTCASRDTFLETGASNEVNPGSLRTVKRKENQISLRDEED